MGEIVVPGDSWEPALRRWETNRGSWNVFLEDGEPVLALPENPASDWQGGTVAIAGDPAWRDYELSLDLMVLPPENGGAGAWPGIVFRAQDTTNYDLVWLMPQGPAATGNVAYVPVAHGMVPWWTDAYVNNPRGTIPYRTGEWLPITVAVRGLEASVSVFHHPEPALTVRLTYYLRGGRVGVYCGTHTRAKFRRLHVRLLEPSPIPDPPDTATPRGPAAPARG